MRKLFTSVFSLALASVAFAQDAEEAPEMPVVGQYYQLVTGFNKSNDARYDKVFGIKMDGETAYYGMDDFDAENNHNLWTFVKNPAVEEGETAYYAMVNKAGEYVPVLGTLIKVGTNVYQDTRFLVTPVPEEGLPAEAYGFDVIAQGTLDEDQAGTYEDIVSEGDTYISIRPIEFRDNLNDPESVAENTLYYLNAAGGGRYYYINLWFWETAPHNSEFWILVPEPAPAVAPEVPEYTCTIEPEDGVVSIPAEGTATITITAEEGAQIAYMFVAADSTEEGEYTTLDENPASLDIDQSGTLSFKAVRDDLESDVTTITFVVETSGIQNVEVAAAKAVVYDLQGRVVNGVATKGIYVSNGKKILVK